MLVDPFAADNKVKARKKIERAVKNLSCLMKGYKVFITVNFLSLKLEDLPLFNRKTGIINLSMVDGFRLGFLEIGHGFQ